MWPSEGAADRIVATRIARTAWRVRNEIRDVGDLLAALTHAIVGGSLDRNVPDLLRVIGVDADQAFAAG